MPSSGSDPDARLRPPTPPPARSARPAPLTADAWVDAALGALARDGVAGVRIEALARSLGVTKGSFYWHFRDRNALHEAMLAAWRARIVIAPMTALRAIACPIERYRAMLRLPFGSERPDFDTELAVRLWSRHDARARAHLHAADVERIAFITEVLITAGAPPAAAPARAALVFAYIRVGGEVSGEDSVAGFEALLVAN